MGFWLKEGKAGLLPATVAFPRLSPPLPALPRVRKGQYPSTCSPSQYPPHRATTELHLRRRQARRQPCREDGGFLRKRMQMREERELLIHVMSAELSMTN